MNETMKQSLTKWIQDQTNEHQRRLRDSAQQHTECETQQDHHQDAKPAFTGGFDHGSTTLKTATNVTNAELHCRTQCHAPDTLYHEFLCEEYTDFHKAAFWVMLPLKKIWALTKVLQLSLMAIQGEQNHQPHMKVAHSWFEASDHTAPDLPHEVMQFDGMLA